MLELKELHTRILEALHRYKYLTPSQLQQIGISSSLPVIWRELRKLQSLPGTKPVIGTITFPPRMRIEHVERVHYLTPEGADVLADVLGADVDELDFRKVTSVYHRDYWHRKYCIDFHIWLAQALEATSWAVEIAVWDRYFDKTGANRTKNTSRGRLRAKTRLDLEADGFYIIPDINFTLRSESAPERAALFSLEMCNGNNTKRVLRQIGKHAVAMREGAMAERYDVPQNYRALFLFSERGLMDAVIKRLGEIGISGISGISGRRFEHLLYFGQLEDAADDPLGCWQQLATGAERYNFVTGRPVS